MRFLYFDCFSGVSGDILIASLLDLGIDFAQFTEEMDRLNLNLHLSCQKVTVNGINGTRFLTNSAAAMPVRHLEEVSQIIEQSSLPSSIKNKAQQVFKKLAEAEAQVHGIPLEKVHFHEIGAVDTIIDIVGSFVCLDLLGVDQVYCSPLPWFRGFVNIDHGRYPLPAPATALLMKGVPCHSCNEEMELVTPTGAALITSISSSFGPIPDCIPLELGYGAGSRTRSDGVPNLLRAVLATPYIEPMVIQETIGVLETQVDDISPEIIGYLFDLLFKDNDVLDFYTTPVHMKKNRPGVLLTVITQPLAVARVSTLLLKETGTMGVRHRLQPRSALTRHQNLIETPWGLVKVKEARLPGGGVRVKPEFEDCRAIASANNLSLQEVYLEVSRRLINWSPANDIVKTHYE